MPSFEIQSGLGRRWASATFEQINGSAGLGFCRLNFNLSLHVEPATTDTPDCLLDLRADMRVGNALLGLATVSPQMFPIKPVNYGQDRSLGLSIDLDHPRLEALEAARNGKDLQLTFMVYSQVLTGSSETSWNTSSAGFVANQSTWAQVLEQLGYRKTLLLEIPVPDEKLAPDLASASKDLEHAQHAMERGDYREAVGRCRDVMENILRALKDTDTIDFTNLRAMDKTDRLRLLRRAFRAFTHPARHRDEVSVAIEWNRTDAACAISVAAALLTELSAPGAR